MEKSLRCLGRIGAGRLAASRRLAVALMACLLATELALAEGDCAAREAVEALEAYAIYKMGRHREAFDRFRQLADKGNVQGMLNSANMLSAGRGVVRDPVAALRWYRLAAGVGDAVGMYHLARAYEEGIGTPADSGLAERWYRSAAEQRSTEAQLALGKLLRRQGRGTEGLTWIRMAAEAGDVSARRYLATPATATRGAVSAAAGAAVRAAYAAIDRAAAHRNAPGVVYYLRHDATVQLRLPGTVSWTPTDKSGLQALWQATFDQAGDEYRVERSELEITGDNGGIRVVSVVQEQLAGRHGRRQLKIIESAEVEVVDDRMVMNALSLEMAQAR